MTLYLPIGPPASGKSSLAKGMVKSDLLSQDAIVSPDDFRIMLTGSVSDQSANGLVFALTEQVVRERIKRGLDVWYDATNLTPEWRAAPVNFATMFDAQIVCIMMTANDETCLERNHLRGQPVPDDVMRTMLERRRSILYQDLPGQVVTDLEFIRQAATALLPA